MIDTHILETASSDVKTHRLVACLKYEKIIKKKKIYRIYNIQALVWKDYQDNHRNMRVTDSKEPNTLYPIKMDLDIDSTVN